MSGVDGINDCFYLQQFSVLLFLLLTNFNIIIRLNWHVILYGVVSNALHCGHCIKMRNHCFPDCFFMQRAKCDLNVWMYVQVGIYVHVCVYRYVYMLKHGTH